MLSEFAQQKAAQAWCTDKTSHIDIDPALAIAFAEVIDEYREALIWCSGSADFGLTGEAREGWLKICEPLLRPTSK